MSVSPGEPLSASPDSPETDEEMSDLSTFQIKWKNLDPLSPMSVGDDQEIVEREKSLKMKIFKTKPPPPLTPPATTTKTANVSLLNSPAETENMGYSPGYSPGHSLLSPRLSESPKYFSFPNLLP